MTDEEPDEADKWFYDLGKLGSQVEDNQRAAAANHAASAAANAKTTRTTRRVVALAAVTLFALIVLAWRTEVNGGHIADTTDAARRDFATLCVLSRENAESMSVVIDQVLVQIRALPDDNPDKATYLRIYTAAKPKIPDCGDRRSP